MRSRSCFDFFFFKFCGGCAKADAEAAFKKLAAAFEKLIDPAQQAACLAETTRKRARQNDRSDAGRAGGGMGWGPGVEKFPRWCKEGEYVPKEKTGEESTPDAAGQKVGRFFLFYA